MNPAWHVMIGVGIGLVGLMAVLLSRRPTGYENNNSNRYKSDYFSEPGQICPICLEQMESFDMQYLRCGHSLHDRCCREHRKHLSTCPTCRAPL